MESNFDKRKMGLEEPIRGLGMARIPIQLHPEVVATILCSNLKKNKRYEYLN